MNAITGMLGLAGAAMETAEVLAREAEGFTLLCEGRERMAQRAFSCLVQPEPGDVVLLGRGEAGDFILAVLERHGDAPMQLALPDGVTLAADGRMKLEAGTLVMEAETGHVAVKTLGVSAARTDARVGRLALVADAVETIAQRVIGRFRRSYRFVEEGEHLRARDVDHRASGHFHLRGDTVAVQGGALVKTQAAQIHMG